MFQLYLFSVANINIDRAQWFNILFTLNKVTSHIPVFKKRYMVGVSKIK